MHSDGEEECLDEQQTKQCARADIETVQDRLWALRRTTGSLAGPETVASKVDGWVKSQRTELACQT